MISLNKKQPKYLYKLNVALVVFFVLWFTLGIALMVTIGCLYGESVITYAVMASTFALFFIGLAIFIIIDKKLHRRFINERAAQLEEEFCDMPFEEAERILKENGFITDNGFIVDNPDVFGNEVLPFEDALFNFCFLQLTFGIDMDIELFRDDGEFGGIIKLDRPLYNFLANKNTELKDDFAFNLLINDKKEFAKYALSYNGMFKTNFRG